MRRLWIAVIVLVVLLTTAFWNTRLLQSRAENVICLLEQAQQCAQRGERGEALLLTGTAWLHWEKWEPIFLIVLDHEPVDEVSQGFCDATAYLQNGETGGEYSAANESLCLRIRLMVEMERLSLENFL